MNPKPIFAGLLCLLLSMIVTAQDKNPFESIGKTGKILTLSNGRYDEFFEKDSLERVGSVIVNRYTRKIEKFLNEDSLNQTSFTKEQSRFLSVDPITRQYPELTPYQFASNRPIDGIDLDGLEWELSTINQQLKIDAGLKVTRDQVEKQKVNSIALYYAMRDPNMNHYQLPTTKIDKERQTEVNERNYLAAGYNADGSKSLMMKLAENKTWNAFADNLAFPMMEGYTYLSGLGELRALFKGAEKVSFFTIQGEADATRLLKGGTPWPTSPTRAQFGEGVYSWGTKKEAEAYLNAIQRSNPDAKLKVMEFSIKKSELEKFNTFKVPIEDDAANKWLQKHSSLYGEGLPHNYQYIQGNTNMGTEHYFSKELYPLLKFKP